MCVCNEKWSEFLINAEHFSTKGPSTISPLLQCETTAVPFKMASRLIFIPLFYLHIMHSEMGFACMERVSQRAQCASSGVNAEGGHTPLGKH